MNSETARTTELQYELKRASWSLAATVAALADIAEIRGIEKLESHSGGIMADQVLNGCIGNLRSLAQRLETLA